MAINPLFSGPGQSKNLFPSFIPPRNKSPMAFPAPNKKPRISTGGGSAEVDPFEDEESFTADDLEQIDIIESQALSQIPRDHTTSATMSSKPHVNGAQAPHGFSFKPLTSRSPNVPRTPSVGFQPKAPNRYPPKTGHGQARGQDSRQNNLRQTNVTVPVVAELGPSKIYTGYRTSSQDGVNSSPPFVSSQSGYKKGVEAQPTSRNPRLQQSNVSFALPKQDSPQSQGFGVSHTLLPQDSDHQHSTSNKPFQHAVPAKEVRHSLSAQTMAQGGAKSKALTPSKGSTSLGTPNLPIQGDSGEAQRSFQVTQELEKLKEELKNLKSERYSKNGEIQVLRQNLGKYKAEVDRLKMEKMEHEEKLKREQSEKDKELAKEAESLKTQLQFKERELAEAQSSYRSLEQRLQTNNNTIMSKNPITPPRNSPRFKGSSIGRRVGEPVSSATSQQEGAFPTRESFMQTNPAMGSPAKVKMRLVEEGNTSKGFLRSPKRAASRSPARSPKVMMKRKISSSKVPVRRDIAGSTKLTLSSRYPSGHISSAQLIGRLMGQPHSQDYNAASLAQGSLISTLQAADPKNLDSYPTPRDAEANIKANIQAVELLKSEESNTSSSRRNKNYESAMRALSSLLNFSTSSGNASANKLTSCKLEDSELEQTRALNIDHSKAILGVLPLLEDQLTGYIDFLHLQNVCSSSLASTCPSSSGGGAGRGLDSSVETVAREEQLQFEMKESQAVNALHTLHCLVCYSPVVADHIMHGDGSNGSEGDTSLMEIDPSAPLIDPTQAPCRATSQQHTSTRPTNPSSVSLMTSDLPQCQILKRLIKIVGMQPSERQGHVVLDTALRILLQLARGLSKEDAFRFSELLSSEVLHPLLTLDNPPDILCTVLTMLSSLALKSWHLTQNLCTHSDSCLLLQVYQCATQDQNKFDTTERLLVAHKIINLLSCVTSVHEEGAAFLLDTDCQCSEEVVTSLVVMLSSEFRLIDSECELLDQRLLLIRKGLLPLHALFMDSHFTDHRLEAEQQYNHLITEMNRLVSRLPQIHRHEVGFLQDFDGSDEDDWDQDSQEQATQMEVN